MTRHRPRWRAYLLLARASNLPTVWTNVLTGLVVAGGPGPTADVFRLCAGVSLLYTGGMFLNDVFDRHVDAAARSIRPLPAGDLQAGEAGTIGAALLLAGIGIASGPASLTTWWWAIGLAGAIVYYDLRHKRDPLAPVVMGICRGLVYCVAASTIAAIGRGVLAPAAVITTYVMALTMVARWAPPVLRPVVPVLIAGICLVDAIILLIHGAGGLAAWCLAAFALTLVLQRFIPGD